MAYTIMSGDKVTVAQVDAVAAIAEGAHHASTGETVIADSDGALVATIRRGADLSSPGGLVAVLADGTRVDLSETESPRAARELIRAAMQVADSSLRALERAAETCPKGFLYGPGKGHRVDPCTPRVRDGRCVWCERDLPKAGR